MLEVFEDNTFEEKGVAVRPCIKPIYDSDQEFYLSEDYYLCFSLDNDFYCEIEIFIPAFFIFNGASIPRFFWRMIGFPLSPRFIIASLIHDALFGKIHGRVKVWVDGHELKNHQTNGFFNQSTTDSIFKGILIAEQNCGWKVRMMHRAVRLGGRFAFRKSENKFYQG
jgi:hypothetical protein